MHKKKNIKDLGEISEMLTPSFARGAMEAQVPKYQMPQGEMLPETAYYLIHDELMLDGNARLNLATFISTWMEPEADRLMSETCARNLADKDEYTQTAELESRCVNMVARLWNSPDGEDAVGTSTIGSSEAAMLGGMALLKRWRKRREAEGKAADRLQDEKGLDIPIHVDGASGGFVAPFLQPEIEWDFRVPRVRSINASGHKYSLVYPGVGWIIWRTQEALPEELVFKVNYLGGEMPTFSLNFSRPGSQVVAQYYNFLRLGMDGYRRIHKASQDVALYLSGKLAGYEELELISDGSDIPVFAFRMTEEAKKSANYTVFDISERLRDRGWQLPAYTFPKNCEHIAALRVVVREGFSRDMADLLLGDFERHMEWFRAHPEHKPRKSGHSFRH
ncbi:MAG: pyridoxal-dependent decarboxylase [Thermoleophilia bacterium]